MKFVLDGPKIYKKYDTGHCLDSIKMLPKQCLEAYYEAKRIRLPQNFRSAENIAVLGMGGSNIGSDLIRSVFQKDLKIPLQIVAGYDLPGSVNKNSLIIVSSYSGNTEETVAAACQAIKNKYSVFVITTGGKLAEMAKKYRLPTYLFKPRYNPSAQPRLGLGYSIMAQLAIYHKLGFIDVSDKTILAAIQSLEKSAVRFFDRIPAKNNLAKNLAKNIYGRIPVIFSSHEFLGNAHIFCNQINENAKNFACYFALPELNHHLLEGLTYPKINNIFIFIFLESDTNSQIIKKRFMITKKVLKKKGLLYQSVNLYGPDKLAEALWLLSLGTFASFYLAVLNKVNPVFVPWVDYFKKELKK